MGVAGDGENIYVGNNGPAPMYVSPETDGTTWTKYRGGAQSFSSQPFEMHYDSANGIMYSANWDGLYALKVVKGGNAVRPARPSARNAGSRLVPASGELLIEAAPGKRYTLRGRRVAQRAPAQSYPR
jgi:hypothetical protein